MQIFADLIWIFEQYLHVLCNIEYTMVVTYEKKKKFVKKYKIAYNSERILMISTSFIIVLTFPGI